MTRLFKPTNKTPHNPSKRATARIKDPTPIPTECRYCLSTVTLVNNAEIYGREYGAWPWAYRCMNPGCDAHIGLHPFTAIPLGTLADKSLREARVRAKGAFNPIWQGHMAPMTRTDAYAWLARVMDLPPEEAHFGLFNEAQCEQVTQIIRDAQMWARK